MPVIDGRGTRPVVQSGDLAFLQQKEQEGKLKTSEGTLTTTGDLCSLTANVNRDLYLAEAKVSITASNAVGSVTIELSLDGVVEETYSAVTSLMNQTAGGAGGAGNSSENYTFTLKGRKVSAGQIIKLEVTAISNVEANGVLEGWEETSGSQSFGAQTVTVQSDGSDISFLRNKANSGDLVIVTGNLNAVGGELVSFTPPTGKTFYLYKASITSNTVNSASAQKFVRVEVRNDGVVMDYLAGSSSAWFSGSSNAGAGSNIPKVETTILADKLVGDSIKKYSLEVITSSLDCYGTLIGWTEDT